MAKLRSLFAILLALLLVTGTAIAQDGDDEEDQEDDDHQEFDDRDEETRSVRVESDAEGLLFELERESGDIEDQVEVRFRFEDATFSTKYEAEDLHNETELELVAQLESLFEYRDENDNGRYDAGETIVSAYVFSDGGDELEELLAGSGLAPDDTVSWQPGEVTDIDADGVTGKQVTAHGTFSEEARIDLTFKVFGDFVDLDQSTLRPTSVKFDIHIRDYPFQADDTALALAMKTESEAEIEHDEDDDLDEDDHEMEGDEHGVAATTGVGGVNVTLAFVWKDHAIVDGAQTDVAVTTLESTTETESDGDGQESTSESRFVLSYARGSDILHDPESYVLLSAGSGLVDEGIPAAPLVLLLGGLLAVAAVARRR